jgi:hypothetical protein
MIRQSRFLALHVVVPCCTLMHIENSAALAAVEQEERDIRHGRASCPSSGGWPFSMRRRHAVSQHSAAACAAVNAACCCWCCVDAGVLTTSAAASTTRASLSSSSRQAGSCSTDTHSAHGCAAAVAGAATAVAQHAAMRS